MAAGFALVVGRVAVAARAAPLETPVDAPVPARRAEVAAVGAGEDAPVLVACSTLPVFSGTAPDAAEEVSPLDVRTSATC